MGLISVGDVHGCARTLDALLEALALKADDHLVFVGDYVDRGPDSKGVIDRLIGLGQEYHCTFLRGNHEALVLDYLDRGEFELWRMNGGIETLESYRTPEGKIEIPEAHIDFIRETVLYYETDEFFFVHAGLHPELSIAENVREGGQRTFLWERGHLEADGVSWEKTVVCGHTPHSEPISEEKLILIDTGCVYHHHPKMGKLTAVRLPDREFVSVTYSG